MSVFQNTNFGALAVKLSKTACPFMSVLCCAGRGDNCWKGKHLDSLRFKNNYSDFVLKTVSILLKILVDNVANITFCIITYC